MNRFENKICLVTGAGSGIGKATALAFAKEQGLVVAADINENAAKAIAATIEANGGKAIALKADISDRSEVKSMIAKTFTTMNP